MIYQGEVEINIMAIDATFWVAISFIIFFGGLIYLKIPQKVNELLNKLILDIKNEEISLPILLNYSGKVN